MEHLGEFLFQVCNEENREAQQLVVNSVDMKPLGRTNVGPVAQQFIRMVQRPEHFYVYVGSDIW